MTKNVCAHYNKDDERCRRCDQKKQQQYTTAAVAPRKTVDEVLKEEMDKPENQYD